MVKELTALANVGAANMEYLLLTTTQGKTLDPYDGSVAIDAFANTGTVRPTHTIDARLGVFVGRDLKTNPATAQDFDRLTMTTTGKGVAIVKGDGSGTLKKGYLDLAGTQYYALTTAQQAKLDDIFTNDNRFKMVEQQYTPA